ncbi:MAG: hypothetical protein JNJ91_06620 [Flavobacteriales bacterium]|nr:hypothetical protein [Flavobacteriales bacterium]
MNGSSITLIGGFLVRLRRGSFEPLNQAAMTIGRKFTRTPKDNSLKRLLDMRTRAVLHAISSEPRGNALSAYLRAMDRKPN